MSRAFLSYFLILFIFFCVSPFSHAEENGIELIFEIIFNYEGSEEILPPECILLDGNEFENKKISPGPHRLTVIHPGFERLNEELFVPHRKKTLVVRRTLTPKKIMIKTNITFDIQPGDLGTDYKITMTSTSGETRVIRDGDMVNPGKYRLKIEKESYSTVEEQKIILPRERPYVLEYRLEALLVPVELATELDVPSPLDYTKSDSDSAIHRPSGLWNPLKKEKKEYKANKENSDMQIRPEHGIGKWHERQQINDGLNKLTPHDRQEWGRLVSCLLKQPKNNDTYEQLISILERNELRGMCVELCNIWLDFCPTQTKPYLKFGEILEKMGDKKAAFRVYTSIADIQVGEASTVKVLGDLLIERGFYDEGIRMFEDSIKRRPEYPDAYFLLARLYEKTGKWKEAESIYLKILKENFDFGVQGVNIYRKLSTILQEQGNLEESNRYALLAKRYERGHMAPADIKVVMMWNTRTDIDLWVTEPNKETCWYSHRTTTNKGQLYKDITTGMGPEIYWINNPPPGEYIIESKFYSGASEIPTKVEIHVYQHEGTPQENVQTFNFSLNRQGDSKTVTTIQWKGDR